MRILVIRFSSIGDIVLTSPIIRCLKAQIGAELHLLTKAAYAPIFAAHPDVSSIITVKKTVQEVLPKLRANNYDYIVDLHKNLRSWQVKRALSIPSASFDKLNWEKWLYVNLKINTLPKVHIVERYFAAVASLGVTNDGKGLDYFIPENTPMPPLPDVPYVAFAIGGAHATKRLPDEKIHALCTAINYPILLLGGKQEAELGAAIAQANQDKIWNYCGKISIHQSAALLREAAAVLTHDTGMMHVAAAFKKPIVSVWGNTVPAFGMYPYYGVQPSLNTSIEVRQLACRPCSKIGYSNCPKGHFKCMRNISETEILVALHSAVQTVRNKS